MSEKANKTVRKYHFRRYLILLLYFLIAFSIIWIFKSVWAVLVCGLLYLPVRFLVGNVAARTFYSVVFKDLDAFAFQESINSKGMVPPLPYLITAALMVGDYQTAVNLATAQLRKEKTPAMAKKACLIALANVYFELRDYEKLRLVIEKTVEYQEQKSKKSSSKKTNTGRHYYQYFLEHNYEACKALCKNVNLASKPKARNANFRKTESDFYYAVACYENGEIDEAKVYFEKVVSFAPRIHLANVSQKYLEAIEQGQPPVFFDTEILPENNFRIYDDETIAKVRKRRQIMRVCFIIVVAGLALYFFWSRTENMAKRDQQLYERKLNQAFINQYGQATVIEYFNVVKDGKELAALCLAEIDGNLVLVEVGTYDNGNTAFVSEVADGFVYDVYYPLYLRVAGYYIGFEVSSTKPIADSLYSSTQFVYDNHTYWFCIDYFEKFPEK